MKRAIAIGRQSYETIISRKNFYVDKTLFIKDWWESEDDVTLIYAEDMTENYHTEDYACYRVFEVEI